MWNLKAAIFCSMGVIRKKVNRCVCSGWIPVYVYFKFSVSACYCQTEIGYGIVFFVCGVKFYVVVSYTTNMSSTYRK